MCVGEANRPLEEATFLDPGGTCHLPVAIERKPAGEYRIMIALAARVNDRETCADRASLMERCVTHLNTSYVGYRVQRAGDTFKPDTEVAGARFSHENPPLCIWTASK